VTFRVAALATAFALAFAVPASAAPPGATVSVTTASTAFNAVNMSNTVLPGTPTTIAASVSFTTSNGGAGGSVVVTPVNLTAADGSTIVGGDFKMTCTYSSGSTGFVASAAAALNGPTTCGTLTQGNHSAVTLFTIQITLDDTTTAATPFWAVATTYSGTFTVTATAS
jgi:hypothetical protein